jgi:hypothetical protein
VSPCRSGLLPTAHPDVAPLVQKAAVMTQDHHFSSGSHMSSQSLRMSERSQTTSSGCTSSADSGRGTSGLPPLDMSISMSLSRDYSSHHTSLSSPSTPNQTLKLSSDSAFNFEYKDPFLFSMPSQDQLEDYQRHCSKEAPVSCPLTNCSNCCKRNRDDSMSDWTRMNELDISSAQRIRSPQKKRQRVKTIVLE